MAKSKKQINNIDAKLLRPNQVIMFHYWSWEKHPLQYAIVISADHKNGDFVFFQDGILVNHVIGHLRCSKILLVSDES